MSNNETNQVYRKQTCAWGKKVISLLNDRSIQFDDNIFSSRDEENTFKEKYEVDTTPQVFLDGERIGGYSELAEHFGITAEDSEEETSYIPVAAVFVTTLLMALATSTGVMGFMGFSLCVLACLKLMDIAAFMQGFRQYDLLTRIFPPYGRLYPFIELFAGLGFLSGLLPAFAGALALIAGSIGGISVFKAVYIDKTDLNCACIGGNSKTPLGIVSFSENAIMAGMGLWLLITIFV